MICRIRSAESASRVPRASSQRTAPAHRGWGVDRVNQVGIVVGEGVDEPYSWQPGFAVYDVAASACTSEAGG
jgi:hypothetical protein